MTSSLQGAGRELDAEIAEKVMGWRWFSFDVCGVATATSARYLAEREATETDREWRGEDGIVCIDATRDVPRYSTDISAAWLVVEKMTTEAEGWERWSFGLFFDGDSKQWTARFSFMMLDERENEYPLYSGEASADTAPLAICLAARSAMLCATPPASPQTEPA